MGKKGIVGGKPRQRHRHSQWGEGQAGKKDGTESTKDE